MAKPKPVTVELIPPGSEAGAIMYAAMNRLIEAHHEELTQARIALAWNMAWKMDADGRITLGKCKRASDLEREFAPFDFVILLNREFYENGEVTNAQRAALLDHELSHAAPKLDQGGEQVEDARGRKVWRIRKHDVEEFAGVIERNGTYKADLEAFARALSAASKSGQGELFSEPVSDSASAGRARAIDGVIRGMVECMRPRGGSGVASVEITSGGRGVRLNRDGSTEAVG